ncbi:MAG: PRC-barrel domain-containing protein [Dehalococcoidia bacterium]|nr:PRC-barrel domain-containing protein [Dehalococcoidia bacterium]
MKVSKLKGMSVVNLADGARIGRIENVLIDTAALQIRSLVLTAPGGESTFPFASARIGPDAVTVDGAESLQTTESTAESVLRSLDELDGMKVVNADGAYLGDARELEISEADGALEELEAHRGGVLGMGGTSISIPVASIRAIGPDFMTVDAPAPD